MSKNSIRNLLHRRKFENIKKVKDIEAGDWRGFSVQEYERFKLDIKRITHIMKSLDEFDGIQR